MNKDEIRILLIKEVMFDEIVRLLNDSDTPEFYSPYKLKAVQRIIDRYNAEERQRGR